MGVASYNAECRKIVMRYSQQWEVITYLKWVWLLALLNPLQEIITRMGRWIDFRNDYKTMYPWFMESVW